MNECDYELHGGEEDKAGHFVNGETDIVCPEGKKIEVHIYANATNHAKGVSACTVTIGSQKGLKGNTGSNIEGSPDHLTLVTSITGIAVSGDGLLCSSAKTATYTGSTTLKAYEDPGVEGNQIKLTMSK